MRRGALLFVLVAFTFSCGGPYPFLQGVAWMSMIREYSEVVPLRQAVQMTFSGQYPCELCKAIAEKKRGDDARFAAGFKQEKKVMAQILVADASLQASGSPSYLALPLAFQTRSESPPTPPPRFV